MGQLIHRPDAAVEGREPSGSCFGKIPIDEIRSNPGKGIGFFEDCIFAPTSTSTLSGWTVGTYGGNGTLNGLTTQYGVWGFYPHTSSQTNTGIQLQQHTIPFQADTDTDLAFGIRFSVTDADQQNIVAGLCAVDSAVITNIATTTDLIGFYVADESANINYMCNTVAGTATDTGSDLADATSITLEFYVHGESKVEFFVNGVKKATATSGIPVDTGLGAIIANTAGEDANNYLLVDWFYAYGWLNGR